MLALVLLTAGLAGCIGSDDGADPASTDAAGDAADSARALNITVPSGQDARDYIESYVMTHPFRVPDDPAFAEYMAQARDDLQAELEDIGLPVTRHAFDGGENILAIQEGTTHPDRWVVLSAHYDTVGAGGIGPTVYGAWDDGAGVASLLELADTLSTEAFPFTIVYAFFDAEEKGLVGSQAFVEDLAVDGPQETVANINMDPPGLNWPCGDQTGPFPVKIIHEMDKVQAPATPFYPWLYDAVEHGLDETEVPSEVRDDTDGIPIASVAGQGLSGTSDHASFGAVDIANVFVGGIPTTIVNGDPNEHTAAALTYPLHTPLDTLEAMEARCQVGTLADGLQTSVSVVAHTLAYLRATGMPTGS